MWGIDAEITRTTGASGPGLAASGFFSYSPEEGTYAAEVLSVVVTEDGVARLAGLVTAAHDAIDLFAPRAPARQDRRHAVCLAPRRPRPGRQFAEVRCGSEDGRAAARSWRSDRRD